MESIGGYDMKIADNYGYYEDFTGRVRSFYTDCIVENATFTILKKPKHFKKMAEVHLEIEKGTVKEGDISYANLKQCDFYGHSLYETVFHSGVFQGDVFERSIWLGGTWQGKTWESGSDKFGRRRALPPIEWDSEFDGTTAYKEGAYNNFTGRVIWKNSDFQVVDADFDLSEAKYYLFFHEGKIKDGIADSLAVSNCVFLDGVLKNSIWNYGTCSGGRFETVTWQDGIWENGVFENGSWYGGIWLDGEWKSGEWRNGTWKGGKWYGGLDKDRKQRIEDDSPDKWGL